MTFSRAVRTCLARYATFRGRASRAEYWWFVLFVLLGSVATSLVDQVLFGLPAVDPVDPASHPTGPVEGLFGLAMLIPLLSAGWRRMHDTGRSGILLFYPVIVMIGISTFAGLMGGFAPLLDGNFGALFAGGAGLVIALALFVLFLSPLVVIWWLASPSEPGPNTHGPNPHEVTS